jgi:hypothetical protein
MAKTWFQKPTNSMDGSHPETTSSAPANRAAGGSRPPTSRARRNIPSPPRKSSSQRFTFVPVSTPNASTGSSVGAQLPSEGWAIVG